MNKHVHQFGVIVVAVSILGCSLSPPEAYGQYFARTPAYEMFGDPRAEFFVHGYSDLTYWDYEKEHDFPLQFHTAPDGDSQFANYFTALFVGSHFSDSFSMLAQLHFHLNPIPGQVGPTVVLPQSKLTWKPFVTENVRFHFGRFYSPFGITNDDVQTPLNRFVSQPYTGFTAIPFHWFDTGIQLDLAGGLSERVGANLVVALTNGPQRIVPDVPPNFQELDNRVIFPPSAPGGALLKTSTTEFGGNVAVRAGLFPGIPNLNIGGSYTTGTLRDEPLLTHDVDGSGIPPLRSLTGQWPAEWDAWGVDLQYHLGRFSMRGDWTRSTEELRGLNTEGNPPAFDQFVREAWRVQSAFHALRGGKGVVKNAWITFRYDERDPDRSIDDNLDLRRYTFGLNLAPDQRVVFKFNYELVQEIHGQDRDNDGFLGQVTASF